MKEHHPRTQNQRGFTLIEMMISVVIIGVLAGIAIPVFTRFLRASKISEAPINLRAVSNGAVAWFNDTHNSVKGERLKPHFPNNQSPHSVPSSLSSSTVPSTPLCNNGNPMYPVNTSRWEKQPWQSLKFGIRKAHYFQYTFSTKNTGKDAYFSALAQADVSCNNEIRTFVQCATINALTGEVELSKTLDLFGAINKAVVCSP